MVEYPQDQLKIEGPTPQYLDNGFWMITASQARKLCAGKLPKAGYAKYMKATGEPSKSWLSDYIVQQTYVSCRTDVKDGMVWSVRFQ
jgi:hypothetical protein